MGKKKIKKGIRKGIIEFLESKGWDICHENYYKDIVKYIYKTYHKGKDKIGYMEFFEDWSAEFNAEIEEAMDSIVLCWWVKYWKQNHCCKRNITL